MDRLCPDLNPSSRNLPENLENTGRLLRVGSTPGPTTACSGWPATRSTA